MFRSGLERGDNEAIPTGIKSARLLKKAELRTPSNPFARQRKSYLPRSRKKKRPFARRVSRKRSWSSSYFALPDVPDAPYMEHRVGGFIGPLKKATYSPFDCRSFYNQANENFNRCDSRDVPASAPAALGWLAFGRSWIGRSVALPS